MSPEAWMLFSLLRLILMRLGFSLFPASATGVSSSTRQRRLGHSGPPTGDFQLHSATDSDSDSDSDAELMRAADRSRASRYSRARSCSERSCESGAL